MVSMFSIGMMAGGLAKNSKIAGVIASILYFPMLIFSAATLPYEVMPTTMQSIVDILPLTQGIKILKYATLDLPMDSNPITDYHNDGNYDILFICGNKTFQVGIMKRGT